MRIISGDYKGRKIFEPLDKETRPLKDLTKESIFNILEHSKNAKIPIKKSNVLDVFSGTGSFGLECISRGANSVCFVEKDINAIKIDLLSVFFDFISFFLSNDCCLSFLLMRRKP